MAREFNAWVGGQRRSSDKDSIVETTGAITTDQPRSNISVLEYN